MPRKSPALCRDAATGRTADGPRPQHLEREGAGRTTAACEAKSHALRTGTVRGLAYGGSERVLVCSFPLTLTLSLGEREQQGTLLLPTVAIGFVDRLPTMLPLPEGEGWGEGERDAPQPRAGSLETDSPRRPRHE